MFTKGETEEAPQGRRIPYTNMYMAGEAREITAASVPDGAQVLIEKIKKRLAYIRELTKEMAKLEEEDRTLSAMLAAVTNGSIR